MQSDVYIVPGWAPLLLSLPVLKRLKAAAGMDNDTITVAGQENPGLDLRRGRQRS